MSGDRNEKEFWLGVIDDCKEKEPLYICKRYDHKGLASIFGTPCMHLRGDKINCERECKANFEALVEVYLGNNGVE